MKKRFSLKKAKPVSTVLGIFFLFPALGQSPQDFDDHFFQPKNLGMSSPQTSEFVRYRNLNVNYYNGLLDMTIPLGGYKDKDFDLPLSIKYVSTGFIPAKRPGLVGHNWFLNFGGVITRQVNGSPDDLEGFYTKSEVKRYMKEGVLPALRDNIFKVYTEQDLLNFRVDFNAEGTYHPYASGDLRYDFEPDIFTFSFGSHTGSFLIGNDGKVKSLSGDNRYKIDISGLAVQPYSTDAFPGSSKIVITTPDGFVYEFGGTLECLEYFTPNNPRHSYIRPRYITSWYLKRITAPNQRTAEFTYVPQLQPFRYTTFLYSWNGGTVRSIYDCPYSNYNGTSSFGDEPTAEYMPMLDKIAVPIIWSVEISGDYELKFFNSERSRFYDSDDPASRCLTRIDHYSMGNKIKGLKFEYMDKGSYFFLSRLTDNEGGEYRFEYNLPASVTLPSPLTYSIDHWGYWSGGNLTQMTDTKGYCFNIEQNRQVNPQYSSVTLLSKITYPAGGSSEITYEPNSYGVYHQLDNQAFGYKASETVESSVVAGGARVKAIKNHTGAEVTETRTFKYTRPDGKSSGILKLMPKYFMESKFWTEKREMVNRTDQDTNVWVWVSQKIEGNDKAMVASGFGFNDFANEYFIGYSDVSEYMGDGSYNAYHYSSMIDVPDKGDVTKNIRSVDNYISSLNDFETAEKHHLYATNDMSRFRGKLLAKTSYSKEGRKVMETRYAYNIENACDRYNISLTGNGRGNTAYKIYLIPCLLMQESSTDSENITQITKYTYNGNHQLAKQTQMTDDVTYYALNNEYVTDREYSTLPAAKQKMVDRNMIDKPVRITKTTGNTVSRTGFVLDAVSFDYTLVNNVPMVSALRKLETTQLLDQFADLTAKMPVRETYHKYDSYGNPVYLTRKDGVNVVYLWCYAGRYPMAQIENATYDQVKAALGGVAPESLSSANADNSSRFTALRTNPNLKNALVTTYKYRPGVGVVEIADPQALTTYYEYDSVNRLSQVYLMDAGVKKIIESYKYHYTYQE